MFIHITKEQDFQPGKLLNPICCFSTLEQSQKTIGTSWKWLLNGNSHLIYSDNPHYVYRCIQCQFLYIDTGRSASCLRETARAESSTMINDHPFYLSETNTTSDYSCLCRIISATRKWINWSNRLQADHLPFRNQTCLAGKSPNSSGIKTWKMNYCWGIF